MGTCGFIPNFARLPEVIRSDDDVRSQMFSRLSSCERVQHRRLHQAARNRTLLPNKPLCIISKILSFGMRVITAALFGGLSSTARSWQPE